MYFSSLADLIYMDGHGLYVWSVYGVAALILGALIVAPLLARRRFIRDEAQRLRREQAGRSNSRAGLGAAAPAGGAVAHQLSNGGG